ADGMRWYMDNLLVKRQENAHLQGTWSLSPTGAGPRVQISGGWSFWAYWLTPGDDPTTIESDPGNDLQASAAGVAGPQAEPGLRRDRAGRPPGGRHAGTAAVSGSRRATASALCGALV